MHATHGRTDRHNADGQSSSSDTQRQNPNRHLPMAADRRMFLSARSTNSDDDVIQSIIKLEILQHNNSQPDGPRAAN